MRVAEMEEGVSPEIAQTMTELKDELSRVSDETLACEKPSVEPMALERSLARRLHANAPEASENAVFSKDDHRFDESNGSYGHNLRVRVRRPPGETGLLEVEYSINIECGFDRMLLVYELQAGSWKQNLRWQAPPLESISDAFGDFFVSAILTDSPSGPSGDHDWKVVVAHGRPWCTSRFSGFSIDVLSPRSDPTKPSVLWHTKRWYSRSDFEPRLKSVGNTFELRLNADCMFQDMENCFERRVIYRYAVERDGRVRRMGPLGVNARGFVHEWLDAPWEESQGLSIPEAVNELKLVHDRLSASSGGKDSYHSNKYGPVRACAASGVFQVEIDSTLEKTVPGKSEEDVTNLGSHYFHVREGQDGYVMLSAPTVPDPSCSGGNLMPTGEKGGE